MSNAPIDSNMRRGIIGVSKTDGTTLVRPYVTNHALNVLVVSSGTDYGNTPIFDENGEEAMFGESSDGSGTLIKIYMDLSTNAVLTKSV